MKDLSCTYLAQHGLEKRHIYRSTNNTVNVTVIVVVVHRCTYHALEHGTGCGSDVAVHDAMCAPSTSSMGRVLVP